VLERIDDADRWSRIIEAALVAVIAVSLVTTILESVPRLAADYATWLDAVEWTAAIILTLEYSARIWSAPDDPRFKHRGRWSARLQFAVSGHGLIDLVSIAPFWLGAFVSSDFKLLLVLRLLRFLKLARYSPAMRSLLDALYAERRALAGCLVILAGAAVFASGLMHLAERDAQPDKFGTLPDALWWAIVTLGTVGYGDAVPITPLGRVIASLTIFAGLLIVALPIGIIASAFASEVHRRDFIVTWGLVARIPLFSGLTAPEIAEVMTKLRSSKIDAGTVICRRGEPAHSMYLIVDGEISLKLKHQQIQLGPGHFFGEIAALRRTKRSATATAVVASRLLVLDAIDLRHLMERHASLARGIEEAARTKLGRDVMSADSDFNENEFLGDGDDETDLRRDRGHQPE
jgi:voltage-gated potassium channel